MKKIIALVLALVMVLSLSTMAFAIPSAPYEWNADSFVKSWFQKSPTVNALWQFGESMKNYASDTNLLSNLYWSAGDAIDMFDDVVKFDYDVFQARNADYVADELYDAVWNAYDPIYDALWGDESMGLEDYLYQAVYKVNENLGNVAKNIDFIVSGHVVSDRLVWKPYVYVKNAIDVLKATTTDLVFTEDIKPGEGGVKGVTENAVAWTARIEALEKVQDVAYVLTYTASNLAKDVENKLTPYTAKVDNYFTATRTDIRSKFWGDYNYTNNTAANINGYVLADALTLAIDSPIRIATAVVSNELWNAVYNLLDADFEWDTRYSEGYYENVVFPYNVYNFLNSFSVAK